jgi:hypothetical protein
MQYTGLDDSSPASLGGLSIRPNRDYWLELHMIEHLPVLKLRKMMQESAYAVLSYIHAAPANLDPAIFGKEVCGLIPLAFVDIVAVGIFEIGQGDEILSPADPVLEFFDLRLQLLQLRAKILVGRTRKSCFGVSKAHATERNGQKIAAKSISHMDTTS